MNSNRRAILATIAGGALSCAKAFGGAAPRRPVVLWVEVKAPGRDVVFARLQAAFARKFTGEVRPDVRMVLFDRSRDLLLPGSREKILEHKPDILIGANSGFALRLRDCNFGLPLLFYSVDDPIAEKMVDSLVTQRLGMTRYTLGPSTEFKRHEFLLRLAPGIKVIGKLQNEAGQEEGLANRSTPRSNVVVQPFHVVTPIDLAAVLALPEARRVDAWDVPFPRITFAYAAQSVPMLARSKKPVIHARLHLLKLGAMAAYEPDGSDNYDVLAEQARLVLGGVPIEQISVVQSSRFRFGLNLPACSAIGINPSKSLLLLADEVLT